MRLSSGALRSAGPAKQAALRRESCRAASWPQSCCRCPAARSPAAAPDLPPGNMLLSMRASQSVISAGSDSMRIQVIAQLISNRGLTVTVRRRPAGGCHSSRLMRPVKSFIRLPSSSLTCRFSRGMSAMPGLSWAYGRDYASMSVSVRCTVGCQHPLQKLYSPEVHLTCT